jgi:hypothetical protein
VIAVAGQARFLAAAAAAAPARVLRLLSMHSGGTPIFVPTLYSGAYYNVRYGLSDPAAAGVGDGGARGGRSARPARLVRGGDRGGHRCPG